MGVVEEGDDRSAQVLSEETQRPHGDGDEEQGGCPRGEARRRCRKCRNAGGAREGGEASVRVRVASASASDTTTPPSTALPVSSRLTPTTTPPTPTTASTATPPHAQYFRCPAKTVDDEGNDEMERGLECLRSDRTEFAQCRDR